MLSLTGAGTQTPAIPVESASGSWQATFDLPPAAIGTALIAEFRSLPTNELALVRVGELPNLQQQLAVSVAEASFAPASDELRLSAEIHNPGPGVVYLDASFIQLIPEGGDATILPGQIEPYLPTVIYPGEALRFQLTFSTVQTSVQVQIGTGRWALGKPNAGGQ